MTKQKVSQFTIQMFAKQYLPALSSAVVLSIADMADALVVGNRMGATGLAAIAFAIPVFMIYNVIMHSFGLGGAVVFSSKMSKGMEKEAEADFRGIICTLFIIGLFFAIIGNVFANGIASLLGAKSSNPELFEATVIYLRVLFAAAPFMFYSYAVSYFMRNDDLSWETSIASQIGNGCDFFLNIILVLFCGLGVMGAALSTLLGVVITSGIEIFFIYYKFSHLRLDFSCISFKSIYKSFKTGISSCISYIYTFIFIFIANNALFKIAGELGVAVFEIVQSISYMMGYIFNAVSMASQPILTAYESECNYEESDRTQSLLRKVTIVTAFVLIILIGAFAKEICILFGLSGEKSLGYGIFALRIFCLCILFAGLNIIEANIYTARGTSVPAFLLSTLRGFVVLVPVMLIAISIGNRAFWYTYFVAEAVTLLIIYIYLKFILKETKRIEKDRIYTKTLHGSMDELSLMLPEIEEFCEKWEADMKQIYYMQMTVEEVCSTIIQSGFGKMGKDKGLIQLTLISSGQKGFALHIRDNAVSFNPFAMDKKKITEVDDSSDKDFNALGMDLIKKKSKSFYYRRYQGFNTMVVKI